MLLASFVDIAVAARLAATCRFVLPSPAAAAAAFRSNLRL